MIKALPIVIDIMGEELKWSKDEKDRQLKMATDFLNLEMGLAVNKSMKEKTPVNLSPDEVNKYKKRFEVIDKEKKGYVSITDIRRALKVRLFLFDKLI